MDSILEQQVLNIHCVYRENKVGPPTLPATALLTTENVTYEVNQLHVAETRHTWRVQNALSLMERSPVTHQCATAPPNHIIHPTAPQTSHDSPARTLQTSGALRKEHGPQPRHPQ